MESSREQVVISINQTVKLKPRVVAGMVNARRTKCQ